MSLSERLSEYVRACYTGVWIASHEHFDALQEIGQLCHREGWQVASWNIATGLQVAGQTIDCEANDPLAAVRAASSMTNADGTTILILENFHHFLRSAEVIQAVAI